MGKTYKERQDGAGDRPKHFHRTKTDKRNQDPYAVLTAYDTFKKEVNASRRRK